MQSLTSMQISKFLGFWNKLMLHISKDKSKWSQTIQFMTVSHLLANLKNDTFQTQLMKQLMIDLLNNIDLKLQNPSTLNMISHGLSKYKSAIIQCHYLKIGFFEYLKRKAEEVQIDEKIEGLYQLDFNTRLDILSTLIKAIPLSLRPKKKSPGNSPEKEIMQEKDQNLISENHQIKSKNHILGGDDTSIYLYSEFVPYVFRISEDEWQILNKKEVVKLIKKLLLEPKQNNNIFLIESLDQILPNLAQHFQKEQNLLPKIQNSKMGQRLKELKRLFLQIEESYSKYLNKFHRAFYASQQKRLEINKGINQASSFAELLLIFQQFYNSTRKKSLFLCQVSFDDKKFQRDIFIYSKNFMYYRDTERIIPINSLIQVLFNRNYEDKFSLFDLLLHSIRDTIQELAQKAVNKREGFIHKRKGPKCIDDEE